MADLSDRKKSLLSFLIKEHIKSAAPVGSKLLAGKSNLAFSSATLRKEMAELEREGYIYQPHTSAGRIPTEKGYRFYINNFLVEKELDSQEKQQLKRSFKKAVASTHGSYKSLAKIITELRPVTVILAFSNNDFYYTGISNLFAQPEFSDRELINSISSVIDKLDEAMADIFDLIDGNINIFLGVENPFGSRCGSLFTACGGSKKEKNILGLLGPLRMDYQANYSLMKYSQELINSL